MAKSGTIVVCLSDTHIGSTVGIAPPRFEIHTGRDHGNETQVVEHNKIQAWLYQCWTDFWDHTRSLAGIRGKERARRLIVVHCGDVVDGLHHGTVQVANESQDQIQMAAALLKPIADIADGFYICYGTPAHNGGTGEFEVSVASEIGARHGWYFPLSIDGVVFDCMHHGRAGRRDWTSSAAGLGAEVSVDYMADGKSPPDWIIRGHLHTVDDSGAKLCYTRVVQLPAWTLKTAHGQKVAGNHRRADIGGLIINTQYPTMPDTSRLRYEAEGGFIQIEEV